MIDLIPSKGIHVLFKALPALQEDSEYGDARYNALYGAWLCGLCLGSVDMGLHHELGGLYNLPHAETHFVMLSHTVAYNAAASPVSMAKLATPLSTPDEDAVKSLMGLYERLGITFDLKCLGIPESGIDQASDVANMNFYKNPRPLERGALRELIRRAWAGEKATSL